MAQRLDDITRTIDRLIPYGEAIVELRGTLTALKEDVAEFRQDLKGCRQEIADNEAKRIAADRQRSTDRRDDRKLLWGIAGGIGAALIAAIGGIVAAGVHP